jgi:hypothetical protein
MTSAPSKIISSSINNLTVWNRESGPIPYCLHLFGAPCRYRIPHIDHHYYNTNATSLLILSWFDLGLLFSSFERAAQKKTFWGESKGFTSEFRNSGTLGI